MTTPADDVTTPTVPELGADWVPLPVAAHRLGISVKTLRRRIKAGEVEGKMMPAEPGSRVERWMVKAPPPPTAAELIPVEVLAKLEEAWQKVSELTGRAEVAERLMAFEKERRERAETELDQLKTELAAKPKRWWQR